MRGNVVAFCVLSGVLAGCVSAPEVREDAKRPVSPSCRVSRKRIGNRDKRIGVCLDVGHERRAGLDPAEFIRRTPDRIVEVRRISSSTRRRSRSRLVTTAA